MNTFAKVSIVMALILVVLGGAIGCSAVGWHNKAIALESQFKAQQKANEVEYDKVWKVIAQKAQIPGKYKEDFKDVYTGIMEKRYGSGQNGKMMLWIKEQNPEFDSSLYKDIMNAVEGQREGFARVQKQLLDIKREHDNLRQQFPSTLICGSRTELEAQLVTSGKTTETFKTGEENDVSLFPEDNK